METMTRKAHKSTPMNIRVTIARLMQLHYDTHPARISATVGLTPPYLRRLWREIEREQWPHVLAALQIYAEMKRAPEVYSEHETELERKASVAGEGFCGCGSLVSHS